MHFNCLLSLQARQDDMLNGQQGMKSDYTMIFFQTKELSNYVSETLFCQFLWINCSYYLQALVIVKFWFE